MKVLLAVVSRDRAVIEPGFAGLTQNQSEEKGTNWRYEGQGPRREI